MEGSYRTITFTPASKKKKDDDRQSVEKKSSKEKSSLKKSSKEKSKKSKKEKSKKEPRSRSVPRTSQEIEKAWFKPVGVEGGPSPSDNEVCSPPERGRAAQKERGRAAQNEDGVLTRIARSMSPSWARERQVLHRKEKRKEKEFKAEIEKYGIEAFDDKELTPSEEAIFWKVQGAMQDGNEGSDLEGDY
jgi:hypothetical protein